MAAGEDETQAVIVHWSRPFCRVGLFITRWVRGDLCEELAFTRCATQGIERTLAGGGRDPAAGVGRQAIPWPPVQRDGERVLDRILGDVEIEGKRRLYTTLAESVPRGRIRLIEDVGHVTLHLCRPDDVLQAIEDLLGK